MVTGRNQPQTPRRRTTQHAIHSERDPDPARGLHPRLAGPARDHGAAGQHGPSVHGFGILKYFPGVSPAENLVVTTIDIISLGLIPAGTALVLTATLECLIGLGLLIGRGLRPTVYLLAVQLIGILSPLLVLPDRLFSGPHHAPTLEGQYVLKDLILVAAAMVIATQFRGARIIRPVQTANSTQMRDRIDMRP